MINQTRLLIDAGNSRIKWTFTDQESDFDTVESHTDLVNAVDVWQGLSEPPMQVWLASVRDNHFNEELKSEIKALWGLPTTQITSARQALGVTNAYAKPEQLGCDRWAAMLAAFHQAGSSVLVVNLGTALTIDAIDVNGLHLGGLISPGIHLQRQALLAGTKIDSPPELDVDDEVSLFAPSTAGGIVSGSIQNISALIDKAFQNRMRHDAKTICYLAGGDAEKIIDTLQCPYRLEPYLVLKGLSLIAAAEST